MSAIALKPCPFCGSIDVEIDISITEDTIYCCNCDASISRDTQNQAIAAWNTRASEADLRRKLDVAREALNRISMTHEDSFASQTYGATIARTALATINGDSEK